MAPSRLMVTPPLVATMGYVGSVSKARQQPAPWLGKFDTTMIWCGKQGLDCQETHGRSSPGPAPAT
jgi:hypothetical protein